MTYDRFFESNNGSQPISIKPFTKSIVQSEDETLEWVKETSNMLGQYYSPYRRLSKDNIRVYVGDGGRTDEENAWNGQSFVYNPSPSRKELNVIQPVVEAHLARITSSRPSVSVLPVHSGEYHDLSAARSAENVIDQLFSRQGITDKFELAGRTMLVCGVSYMLAEWNVDLGPPIAQVGEPILLLDEDGNPQVDEDGNEIFIHPNTRLGDVDLKVLRPDQVLEQPGTDWERKKWVMVMEREDTYDLKEKYPQVADEIRPGSLSPGDSESFLQSWLHDMEHQTLVITLYHKATKAFPNGWKVKITPDVVLESGELDSKTLNSYGQLPIARLHDTDVPGYELPLPMSVMEAGKGYSETFNRVDRVLRKDLSLSVPKWIVHKLSGVNPNQLNNASNAVNFKGNIAPQLIRPSSTSGDFFAYRNGLLQEMKQNTGSSHVFNAPPSNTRATSMLEHQEEQEFVRAEPLIRHFNNFMACVAKISLGIMADKYDDSDERVLKLTGPEGPASFIRMRTADLMGPYDIKFERTSALPESKQGRINAANQMFQMGLIDKTQYKKAIGFSADPDLQTAETKAFEKQLLENDLMIRGLPVEAPLEHEDHVEHLKALYPLIESIEFAEMPDEIRGAIIAHTIAHEMFAWKRAQISLTYAIRVQQHVQWKFFSSLPAAIPVSVDNPASAAADDVLKTRATTPGLVKPAEPGPDSPELV